MGKDKGMATDTEIIHKIEEDRYKHMSKVSDEAKPKALEAAREIPYSMNEDEEEAFISGYIMACMQERPLSEVQEMRLRICWTLDEMRKNDEWDGDNADIMELHRKIRHIIQEYEDSNDVEIMGIRDEVDAVLDSEDDPATVCHKTTQSLDY
jgi:hypothetical protein